MYTPHTEELVLSSPFDWVALAGLGRTLLRTDIKLRGWGFWTLSDLDEASEGIRSAGTLHHRAVTAEAQVPNIWTSTRGLQRNCFREVGRGSQENHVHT